MKKAYIPFAAVVVALGMAAPRRAASDFFNELLVGLALLLACLTLPSRALACVVGTGTGRAAPSQR